MESIGIFGAIQLPKFLIANIGQLMIEIDGIKFYKGYCGPFTYFGMDEANNKLYYLKTVQNI
jgi:hypothetical protein